MLHYETKQVDLLDVNVKKKKSTVTPLQEQVHTV